MVTIMSVNDGKTTRTASCCMAVCLALLIAGCGGGKGEYAQDPADKPPVGKNRQRSEGQDPNNLLFGELSTNRLFGKGNKAEGGGGNLPVNKYLWQASLDTLSFLPLASTDPFTGVIATDWGANPNAPSERFKVTSYMVSPTLSASSLKVAVYREVRDEGGAWVPANVSPDTARQLEDAILTRARQIRIAELEGTSGETGGRMPNAGF